MTARPTTDQITCADGVAAGQFERRERRVDERRSERRRDDAERGEVGQAAREDDRADCVTDGDDARPRAAATTLTLPTSSPTSAATPTMPTRSPASAAALALTLPVTRR